MAKEVSLSQVIKSHVNNALNHIRTALPATIVKYDENTQKASVQPMIHRLDNDGTLHKPSIMYGVPIVFPSAGAGILTFPVKEGDPVLLVISDRSLDNYVYSSGDFPVDPDDLKTHDLSDAVAIVGFYPYKKALGIHREDVVLRMNAGPNNQQVSGENSLHLMPVGKDEAVVINANQYNGNHSVIKLMQNGNIILDTLQGTDVTLTQGGNLTINTPTKVIINAGGDVEVTAGGDAKINAGGDITLTGGGGGPVSGVVTGHSIHPILGIPYPDKSTKVLASHG